MTNIYLNEEEIQEIQEMATKLKKLPPAKQKKAFDLFTEFAATQTDEDIKTFVLSVGDFLKALVQSADVPKTSRTDFYEMLENHQAEIVRDLEAMKENE